MATKGSDRGGEHGRQGEERHPPEWEADLNPNRLAGQNIGGRSAEVEKNLRTAYEVKSLHRALEGFTDDELKQIPVLPPNAPLQHGATYLDLGEPTPRPFTARAGAVALEDRVIPKDEVPYPLWNRLIGREHPPRSE